MFESNLLQLNDEMTWKTIWNRTTVSRSVPFNSNW